MDLDEVRQLSSNQLAHALAELNIPAGWIVHAEILDATGEAADQPCLPEPPARQKLGFQT
jgi:hypothetical protein